MNPQGKLTVWNRAPGRRWRSGQGIHLCQCWKCSYGKTKQKRIGSWPAQETKKTHSIISWVREWIRDLVLLLF